MNEIQLEIPLTVNVKDFEVGVIVCRMQVPHLHRAQKKLIDTVCDNHSKVVIFLGVSRITKTEKNPLDFNTRRLMIQEFYPDVIIMPLRDQREDNLWSAILDEQLCLAYDNANGYLLYGSRDSFIPHYKGRHKTVELISNHEELSGTELRAIAAKEPLKTEEARIGAINQAFGRRPVTYPTVDVVAYNDKGQILLARKPNEVKYRFVGGFVDGTDKNLEEAASREFAEETSGSKITDLQYVCSAKIDDWRYDGERDGILSTLMIGRFVSGKAEASDDIADLKWVDFMDFIETYKETIMVEHHELFSNLIQYLAEKQELIQPKTETQQA